MGQEITDTHFARQDFEQFSLRLAEETGLLQQWFQDGVFSRQQSVAGFELESWLVDQQIRPVADNERFLAALS
ncbi:MAG: hypothetical protein OEX03_07660, partial [Gammaproteobacteria bacterium]|nr:hypothetical protein [Gammaproteobacteria bacterium]